MKKLNKYIPEGMRDLLFDQCEIKNQVINSLRGFYKENGYFEIATPTLEYLDVFYGQSGSIDQESMYKLLDSRGRLLVLRPDMTTPLMRVANTKLREATYPLRVCYSGNIFRNNEILEGKLSEITQSGIEVIGSGNAKSDADVIITAIKALLKVGVKDFHIEIGQAEFFKSLIEDLELFDEDMDTLRSFIEKKNFVALRNFIEENSETLGDNAEALKALPTLFGGKEVLDSAKVLTKNANAICAIENIREVYESLESLGLSEYVSIDLGMIQFIEYYTGTTFRGYSSQLGCSILSGGRYDNLASEFGCPKPATGFAIHVDNVINVLKNQGDQKDEDKYVLVHFESKATVKAYAVAEAVREEGYIVEMSLLDSEDEAIDYGKKKGFCNIIFVSEDGEEKYVSLEN
ncbi:ATP phosphoribosyltransferase regulatory subunit [Clostridium cellulovorans]|uniref:ATP phosphoribosyltransferase regulatory subunit n=1 Tax=Clostridium cellulovorans (strain ATCC 35296 / DSM 3052 / OCM 3 / 743B) TaxID=573061 RepID=D9SL20_CLOC7|nr:ATP phosphoribosyltransferase regulatory subunit [Clostridium cellulovorans]ADL53592.1 histidyl-tRNA synthetase 2 [Clostridium cellulovorans 743B]